MLDVSWLEMLANDFMMEFAKFGRQPDLLADTVELLVDEQEAWAGTCRGGLFVHLGRVHDVGEKAITGAISRIHEVSRLSRQLI